MSGPDSSGAATGSSPDTPIPTIAAARPLKEQWLAMNTDLAERTLTHYAAVVDQYLAFLGYKPLKESEEPDLWQFILLETAICANRLTMNIKSVGGYYCRAKVFPLVHEPPTSCAVTCPKYMTRSPLVIQDKLKAIDSFFHNLARFRHVPRNYVSFVLEDYNKKKRPSKYLHKKIPPTIEQVRTLVRHTLHPTHKAAYALLAKTGLRIHELQLLPVEILDGKSDTYVIPIPADPRDANKREEAASRFIFIDEELRPILDTYRDHRGRILRRRPPEKHPKAAIIGDTGKAASDQVVRDWLAADAMAAGLVIEGLQPGRQITPHYFRHFLVSCLLDNECPDNWASHIVGHVVQGTTPNYHYFRRKLREKYFRFRPELGI